MRFGYKHFDPVSYQIGIIECFCELVQEAKKTIALSDTYSEGQLGELEDIVPRIAAEHGVKCHLEFNLVKNNIAPDDYVRDKYVFMLYRDDQAMERYFALKEREARLEAEGGYDEAARREITVELCRLLSYPEEHIREKYMQAE